MRTEQSIYSKDKGWSLLSNENLGESAHLVFLFGQTELLKDQNQFDHVRENYPNAEILGCSTSGEICNEEVFNSAIICTAVCFEKTTIKVFNEKINSMNESFQIGQNLADKFDQDKLVHIMIFSEGLNINGSELTKGLNSRLLDIVPVTGGLAGDQVLFNETVVVHNKPGEANLIVAIGFYGTNLKVGYGSLGGWDSFGLDRLVTKSKANVLYELDGQPALDLYKKYLGEHAAKLPSSALLFPLNLKISNSDISLVRTVLSVNEDDGSMVFAGDIPEGEYVRLMKASYDKLIDGACGAAEMAGINLENLEPDLAILISCVGRKLVLKQRVEEELESVREALGVKPTITGFYSYGEICPIHPSQQHCELHNQTMTITVFKEF